jgi:hypothetical protein
MPRTIGNAIGIGEIVGQHADGLAAAPAQRPRKRIGMVAKLLRHGANLLPRLLRDILRQRRLAQHNRHRGHGEAARAGNIQQCHVTGSALSQFRFLPAFRVSLNAPAGAPIRAWCLSKQGRNSRKNCAPIFPLTAEKFDPTLAFYYSNV